MKYKIALQPSDEGFSVSVPGLPGCWSQGATEQEALQNIQDAIQEYRAARDELLEGKLVREIDVGPEQCRRYRESITGTPCERSKRLASASFGKASTSS